MKKYYVVDDEANEDIELGVLRYIVTSDENGEDFDQELARFKFEEDADKFCQHMNKE